MKLVKSSAREAASTNAMRLDFVNTLTASASSVCLSLSIQPVEEATIGLPGEEPLCFGATEVVAACNTDQQHGSLMGVPLETAFPMRRITASGLSVSQIRKLYGCGVDHDALF